MSRLEKAMSVIRDALPAQQPGGAMILGSGWANALKPFPIIASLPYDTIPGLGSPTTEGHAGDCRLIDMGGTAVLAFVGRRHWYEGLGWEPVALPVYAARQLGVRNLLLTNAAGAINPELHPGSLMLVRDHLNLMGANPLVGPHAPIWGPRFPDMGAVYDKGLRDLLTEAALRAGIHLATGVYAAVSGPTYETPAEIRLYRRFGADAVGMSTVPEAILAHAAGLRVAAVSCISNMAAGLTGAPLSHADVMATGQGAVPDMTSLLEAFFAPSAEQTGRN